VSLPSDNPVLDARGLVFPADGSVLNQVSLAVGEGETVAVLGGAGSGKSALKACLCVEATAAAGMLWTNGKPVHLLAEEQRRAFRLRHFGLVHQQAVFLPELTLADNCALPLRFAGVTESAAARRALTWLARFEIAESAGRRPGGLPAEVLRRGALVRAMVNDPLVLLADEPFLGLCEESVDTTSRILFSVARSHGTAVIVFTRDAATAARSDRILHLANGRLRADPVRVALAAATPPDRPVAPDGPAQPPWVTRTSG
jgi:predicted ABC-type transport system involved in lysophospholipase L1 biosynthesis ATPase subunit